MVDDLRIVRHLWSYRRHTDSLKTPVWVSELLDFWTSEIVVHALDHLGCCIGKHRSLIIVAISMQRINLILFPQPGIYLIFLFKKRVEINQYGYWLAWYCPSAHTDFKALLLCFTSPFGKKRLVFLEIGAFLFFPEIGSDKDYPVL